MSEDFLMTEWKDTNSKTDGNREAGDGTDVVLALQQTSSPVILKPPLPSAVQQPYQDRRKNIGGQDLQGVSPNGDVAFHNSNETSKLLDLSSSSSSESDLNLQIIPPKRKVRFKRKLRPIQRSGKNKNGIPCREENNSANHSCCCCTGGEGLSGLAFVLVFCALGTLMWFHYGLSSRLYTLQKQYNNLETQSKETPEALHDYHIQLKGLESNVTAFAQGFKKINSEIQSLQEAVKQLKEVSDGLRDSIAAAPDIKTLPKDVVSLTESVAALGSKISMLESNVEDLKKGQRQLTDSERELKNENQQIKASMTGLSVQKESSSHEDAQALQSSLTEYLHQELSHMTSSVDELNTTMTSRLKELDQQLVETNLSVNWVSNDLAQLHVFVYQNLSTGSYSAGKTMDPSSLGASLQQEAQRILHEVLINGSLAQNSEGASSKSPASSGWKDVLTHAHEVSLAYWALLKDLSLTPADVQNSSVLSEAVMTRVVSQLNTNNTAALQALNSSLISLSSRTQTLELRLSQSTAPVTTPAAVEPRVVKGSSSPTVDTSPKQPSPPESSKALEGQTVKAENMPNASSASANQEDLGIATTPTTATALASGPTVLPSSLVARLRAKMPAPPERKSQQPSSLLSDTISSNLDAIQ